MRQHNTKRIWIWGIVCVGIGTLAPVALSYFTNWSEAKTITTFIAGTIAGHGLTVCFIALILEGYQHAMRTGTKNGKNESNGC